MGVQVARRCVPRPALLGAVCTILLALAPHLADSEERLGVPLGVCNGVPDNLACGINAAQCRHAILGYMYNDSCKALCSTCIGSRTTAVPPAATTPHTELRDRVEFKRLGTCCRPKGGFAQSFALHQVGTAQVGFWILIFGFSSVNGDVDMYFARAPFCNNVVVHKQAPV